MHKMDGVGWLLFAWIYFFSSSSSFTSPPDIAVWVARDSRALRLASPPRVPGQRFRSGSSNF
jgi:hypothetical protein